VIIQPRRRASLDIIIIVDIFDINLDNTWCFTVLFRTPFLPQSHSQYKYWVNADGFFFIDLDMFFILLFSSTWSHHGAIICDGNDM